MQCDEFRHTRIHVFIHVCSVGSPYIHAYMHAYMQCRESCKPGEYIAEGCNNFMTSDIQCEPVRIWLWICVYIYLCANVYIMHIHETYDQYISKTYVNLWHVLWTAPSKYPNQSVKTLRNTFIYVSTRACTRVIMYIYIYIYIYIYVYV
jgi:hypothetical protein